MCNRLVLSATRLGKEYVSRDANWTWLQLIKA